MFNGDTDHTALAVKIEIDIFVQFPCLHRCVGGKFHQRGPRQYSQRDGFGFTNNEYLISALLRLPHAALPLFFQFQFARAEAGIKGEKINQQAVEFGRLVDHREMPRTFQVDLVHVNGK